jgi:hypothetical protein
LLLTIAGSFPVRSVAQALEKRPEDLPGEAALISVVAAGCFMEMNGNDVSGDTSGIGMSAAY